MVAHTPSLDIDDFLRAARIGRESRRTRRRLDSAEAVEVLHRTRDAFRDEAGGPEAAERDADRLERLADRLVDWSGELHRDLARLEIGRDQVVYRGSIPTCLQSPLDAAVLAQGLAESLCDGPLSAHAGAVLRAAVKLAAI